MYRMCYILCLLLAVLPAVRGAESPVADVQFPRQPVIFLPTDAEWARFGYSEHALAVSRLADAHLSMAARGVKDTDHQLARAVEFILEGQSGRYRLWTWDADKEVYQDTVAIPCDQIVKLSLLITPADMKQLKQRMTINQPEAFRLLVNSRVGADGAELGEVQIINFDRLSEEGLTQDSGKQGRPGDE